MTPAAERFPSWSTFTDALDGTLAEVAGWTDTYPAPEDLDAVADDLLELHARLHAAAMRLQIRAAHAVPTRTVIDPAHLAELRDEFEARRP